MKKNLGVRRIVTMLLTLSYLLAFVPETVVYAGDGDWSYGVENGKATITAYSGDATELEIPSWLGLYKVTAIGSGAFSYNKELKSVDIPSEVKSIGESAFEGCSALEYVSVPSGVESIGKSAFEDCSSLFSIDIPKGIDSIEEKVFKNCSSLSSVDIPSEVESIGESAFEGCSSLSAVDLASGLKTIGSYAFRNCGWLGEIIIPEGVTSIGEEVFANCSDLERVTIPGSLSENGSSVFSYSGLRSVTLGKGIKTISYHMFENCEYLESIVLPDGVTGIDYGAFENCSDLVSISVPKSLEWIGENAFGGCDEDLVINYPGKKSEWNRISGHEYADDYKVICAGGWDELQGLLDRGGEIVLEKDYVADKDDGPLIVRGNVILDLNGHIIDRRLVEAPKDVDGYVIEIKTEYSEMNYRGLTLKDSRGGGYITGGCSASDGGGVRIGWYGKLVMEGGCISGNRASYSQGGGVYVDTDATFEMKGGQITQNETSYCGGAVYVNRSATFKMSGGSIFGNDAGTGGGGVCVFPQSSFELSGSPVIRDNTKDKEEKNDLFLENWYDDVYGVVTLSGALTDDAELWICDSGAKTVAVPSENHTIGPDDLKHFHCDDASKIVALDDSGKVVLRNTISVSPASASTTYTGSTITPAITVKNSGNTVLTKDTDYTLSYKKDGEAVSGIKDVGAYTVVVSGMGSYGGTKELPFTVSPKPVTITGMSAEDKDYDGTTDATVSGTATVSGKVENDDVTVTMGTATFADALPGEEKAVSFSGFSLGGTAAGNYTLSAQPASVTAEIRKVTIAPVVSITGWTYGDEAQAPAVTGGNPGNGAVSFAYYTDASCEVKTTAANSGAASEGGVPKNAGTWYVKASVAETANYKAGTATKEFTIAKRSLAGAVITLNPADGILTYTGNQQSVTVESVKLGDTVVPETEYSVQGNTGQDFGIREISITAKGNGDGIGNYTGKITKSYIIAKLEPYVTTLPTAESITYGKALSDASLSGGTVHWSDTDDRVVEGTWAWKDPSLVPDVSLAGTSYTAVFQPKGFDFRKVEAEVTLIVNKAQPAAPAALSWENASSDTAGDGAIYGVDDTMEYSKDGDSNWKDVTGSSITGLSAGTYKVRYKATDNTDESNATTITIAANAAAVTLTALSVKNEAGETVSGTNKTVRIGQTLTAVPEPEGVRGIAFVWYRDSVEIPGATGRSYTLTASDYCKLITVRATQATGENPVEMTSGATRAVYKAAGDTTKPAAPVLVEKTANSISVKAVDGYEYLLYSNADKCTDETLYEMIRSTGIFAELTADKDYYVVARKAETAEQEPGALSAPLRVRTSAASSAGTTTVIEDSKPMGEGFIETEVTVEGSGDDKPQVAASNLNVDLVTNENNKILTDAEKQAVMDGATLTLNMGMKKLEEGSSNPVPEMDKEKAEEAAAAEARSIAGSAAAPGSFLFLDITLHKQINGVETGTVADTRQNIEFTVTAPESMQNEPVPSGKTRWYFVLCVHNGQTYPVGRSNTPVVSVKSHLFSTYVLTYVDKDKSNGGGGGGGGDLPAPGSFTVEFDLNGHGESIDPQNIANGAKVAKPEDPEAEGFVFGGWFTDKECTKEYSFDTPVTAGFTLYAKWTEKDPSVSLNSITITTPPTKTEYKAGEKFDPAGMVVSANYTDGSGREVTGYSWTPGGNLAVSDTSVTITYTEEGITRTASQPISVSAGGGEDLAEHSPLDPVPEIRDETEALWLVQGQKFTLPGSGWSLGNKADKKYVTLSKKGVLTVKKTKKAGSLVLNRSEDGRTVQSLSVNICKPVITKKLTVKTGEETPGEISLEGYDKDRLSVFWYSASPDVATVDQSGHVTAVSRGKAVVTAYINGVSFKCTVTVKEPEVAKERTLHMVVGATKSLSIKGVKKPAWSSASENVAKFVTKNKVKAETVGETVLTATAKDGTEYRVHLFVEDITLSGEGLAPVTKKNGKIVANKYTLMLKAGETTELGFTAISQPVAFTSSKPESAFIDADGHVVARKAGTSKFTTKIDGKTITITVVVKE
ncbi:MAG: leucine-rich repeat protein [Lachnospiraceae bacterium]|nr:leucine-rich repeat protein [Lachnospiraceae bacterium]